MPPSSPRSVLLAAESQWIFTEEELTRTPSGLDGMPLEQERENRGKGVNFITQVGIMLKLPQLTLATASVFLHRFFMRYSMVDKPGRPGFHYYAIAATSLFLATKVEENCRKMKELVVACCRVAQKNPSLAIDEQSKEYWRWRDTILHSEDLLLEAICFDLTLEPPYKTFFEILNDFGCQDNKELRNAGWAFLNDSNLTMLCLLFPSRTIAAAALYSGAKLSGVDFEDDKDGRAWWELLNIPLRDIRRACNYVSDVYDQSPLKRSENIYRRTPENGDPLVAPTRARRSDLAGTSPMAGDREVSSPSKRRREGDFDNSAVGISSKDDSNEDEGGRKRVKLDERQASNGIYTAEYAEGDSHPHTPKASFDVQVRTGNGTATTGTGGEGTEPDDKDVGEGSEEGELEA